MNADAAFSNFRKRKFDAVDPPIARGNSEDEDGAESFSGNMQDMSDAIHVLPMGPATIAGSTPSKGKAKKRETTEHAHVKGRRAALAGTSAMEE